VDGCNQFETCVQSFGGKKTHVLNEWLFGPWGGTALGVTDVGMRYFRIPSSQVPWVMMLFEGKATKYDFI
jgi:hypothetical protein